MGRREEELPKCFPHLYVDEMLAVSPEFKCLLWIDFPARILVCWDVQRIGSTRGSKFQPCLWLPVGSQEGPFPSLCLCALICTRKGLDQQLPGNYGLRCLSGSDVSGVGERGMEKT